MYFWWKVNENKSICKEIICCQTRGVLMYNKSFYSIILQYSKYLTVVDSYLKNT